MLFVSFPSPSPPFASNCIMLVARQIVRHCYTYLLYGTVIHICCTVLLYIFVVRHFYTYLLYGTVIHICCTALLYIFVIRHFYTYLLYGTVIHICCMVLFNTLIRTCTKRVKNTELTRLQFAKRQSDKRLMVCYRYNDVILIRFIYRGL